MKKIIYLPIFLLLFACDDDDDGAPILGTTFTGRVVYDDTREPLNGGIIGITGTRPKFPSEEIIVNEQQVLDENGGFQITFDADERISIFTVLIFENPNTQATTFTRINCVGLPNCNEISPGQDYDDITIELLP
ncbi:MAG: hypothetical protein AAF554_02310 [Bacteroidota bacterium]